MTHQSNPRKLALITGVFFVVTFVTSIGAAILYIPALKAGYVTGGGADTRVLLGALFEVFLIIANIGSAVALFPILKRQSEGLSLGYVTARIIESTFIAVGIISVLAIVTMRHATGADAASLTTIGKSLVAVHDWTFLLGPGFIVGIGNGLMLGYLMFRSGLVPRGMAMLGLIGGPLVCISGIAVLFGAYKQFSPVSGVLTIPEFVWELSLGIYLIVKGFRPSPIVSDEELPIVAAPARSAA